MDKTEANSIRCSPLAQGLVHSSIQVALWIEADLLQRRFRIAVRFAQGQVLATGDAFEPGRLLEQTSLNQ